ncbi:Regulator of G-protein signaling 12 [Varanus komodoensis]|nr:Regulator of G-protein signaling 12 [Varanus komodoensis]
MKNSSKSSSMQINLSGSKQKLPATFISQKTCSVPFSAPLSPALLLQEASIWKMQSKELQVENIQTVEDENVADLTLVAEGDINSPNSTLLPPTPPSSDKSTLAEAKHSPPVLLTDNQEKTTCEKFKSGDNVDTDGKRSTQSPSKKHEKRKHTGSDGATKPKHPKKNKMERQHKKHPRVPHPSPSSLPPILVLTELSGCQSVMQVKPPSSPLHVVVSPHSSPECPEPVAQASISDREIRESPPPSGPDQHTTRSPTPIPGGQSLPEASPRTSHHPSSFLPLHAPTQQPSRCWMPLPYGDFDPGQMDHVYLWDFYPPSYNYSYPPPSMCHQHSTPPLTSRDAPFTSAVAVTRLHMSPNGSSPLSPPYQSDSDSEESQQASTSPDAFISIQGPGLPTSWNC